MAPALPMLAIALIIVLEVSWALPATFSSDSVEEHLNTSSHPENNIDALAVGRRLESCDTQPSSCFFGPFSRKFLSGYADTGNVRFTSLDEALAAALADESAGGVTMHGIFRTYTVRRVSSLYPSFFGETSWIKKSSAFSEPIPDAYLSGFSFTGNAQYNTLEDAQEAALVDPWANGVTMSGSTLKYSVRRSSYISASNSGEVSWLKLTRAASPPPPSPSPPPPTPLSKPNPPPPSPHMPPPPPRSPPPTPFPPSTSPSPSPTPPNPPLPIRGENSPPPAFPTGQVGFSCPDDAMRIICPALSALCKNGDLMPDSDGFITKQETFDAFLAVGISRATATTTTNGNFDHLVLVPPRINVFAMNVVDEGHSTPSDPNIVAKEHFRSTGIRDAESPQHDRFAMFAADSENFFRWTQEKLDAAIEFFDSEGCDKANGEVCSNDVFEASRPEGCGVSDTGKDKCHSNLHDSITFLFQEFGTPTGPNAQMVKGDMQRLWMQGEYPPDFAARSPKNCVDKTSADHHGCQRCYDEAIAVVSFMPAVNGVPFEVQRYCRCLLIGMNEGDTKEPFQDMCKTVDMTKEF
eukprot:6211904-Pleurochrysis_carterae.AAC.3